MQRDYYLELAHRGLRMPIATDLVLHQQPDPERILADGEALGRVVVETARRYRTPLAFAHMDLMREKAALCALLGIPPDRIPAYHFADCPGPEVCDRVEARLSGPLHPALQVHCDSIAHVARQADLLPIGMGIGPFSLTTKLLADPISPIYLAGSGLDPEEEPEIQTLERLLELALRVVLRSFRAQIEAGAKAIFMAEPAANVVYLSPKQIAGGADIFERYVLAPGRRVKALLEGSGVDLIFHCCGELTDDMLQGFCSLDPAILSLGSSRRLWEDARIVPARTVLYGNLPSKHFYSDAMISREEVVRQACELLERMRGAGHPFILGSECDVLHVPAHAAAIREKVEAFTTCPCP